MVVVTVVLTGVLVNMPIVGSAGMLKVIVHATVFEVNGKAVQMPVVVLYLYGAALEPQGIPTVAVRIRFEEELCHLMLLMPSRWLRSYLWCQVM